MLYGLIFGCFSVRDIEASMKANSSRLYHTGLKQGIKRSTFCDALEKKRSDIFQSVFHTIVEKAQGIACSTKKKFKDPMRIIDATIMVLCISRFNWAKYRKSKGAVKLHMNLDGDNLMPYEACITNGSIHDKNKMDNLCDESGVIYVMDRGYIDCKSLYSIELRDSVFVTRIKRNMKYKRIKNNPHKEGGPIISDVLIELTGTGTKRDYPKAMRKVKYRDPETKKEYEFLTNDMNREAEEIAQIYKRRWEVELFFKWIKQHLKIKSFWGTSENAVYSQIWVALILMVLLWINRALNILDVSPHELFVMIRAALLTKNSLAGLCTSIAYKEKPQKNLQPLLAGLSC
jgi:hypothetical protein